MSPFRQMRLGYIVIMLPFCVQANSADDFNSDWILTQYRFQQGEQTYTKGPGPLREDMEEDSLGIKQPQLMGGWKIGKDGFCAALHVNDLTAIVGDLECVADVVNGSLIEIRASYAYAALRCTTVMRLRKIDPKDRANLIGRSQTDCSNRQTAFKFSAEVAYMREGSPGLVRFKR